MKITIESTPEIVVIDGVPCRVWEGEVEDGTPIRAFVALVAIPQRCDCPVLNRDLILLGDSDDARANTETDPQAEYPLQPH